MADTSAVPNEVRLLIGTGAMYKGQDSPQIFRHVRQVEEGATHQHIENIDDSTNKMSDMSEKWEVQRELTEALRQGMDFQKQIMTLTQENADLRVQAERHLSRIRELERENDELRAMRKQAPDFRSQSGRDVG